MNAIFPCLNLLFTATTEADNFLYLVLTTLLQNTPQNIWEIGGSHYCSKESLLGYQKTTDTVWRVLEKPWNSNTGKHGRKKRVLIY